MEERETKYNAGGSFETTIGNTNYEVVMNFRDEGMSMQEKALRANYWRKSLASALYQQV